MSGGGLPAIHPYLIERQYWLNEIRHAKAFKRVHGMDGKGYLKRLAQKELCKIRKVHYGR